MKMLPGTPTGTDNYSPREREKGNKREEKEEVRERKKAKEGGREEERRVGVRYMCLVSQRDIP